MNNQDLAILKRFGVTPDNLSVGGSLDLYGTGITALPDNLSVGGSLDLRGTGITALPDNLSVGGYLYLSGTGITALPDNLSVGGYLDLYGTGITALPDNLSVGGYLYLRGTGITALPDNLSVGGYLDLRGTGITALPDNLRCGRIYWDYIGPLVWRGNLVTIQDIDGYSTVTGGWKRTGDVEVCRARYLAGCDVSEMAQCYVAKQGNIYAHGDTIKDAVCDLKFKIIEGRDISDVVAEIHQTGVVTREQYRVVTGACRAGVAAFLADHGIPDDLESMPLRDVLKLTSGAYGGSDFAAHMEAVKCTSR